MVRKSITNSHQACIKSAITKIQNAIAIIYFNFFFQDFIFKIINNEKISIAKNSQ